MSYILEALKKSEQERRQGQVPDLSSQHGDSLAPPERKMTVKILAAISLISVSAMVVMFTVADRDPVEIPPPPRPRAIRPVVAVIFPSPAPGEITAAKKIAAPPPARAPATRNHTSAKVAPDNKQISGVPRMTALSASVQDHLPRLVISAHFYSKNPKSRMASINGRLLRQGDEVEPGIIVREITPKGVIFDADGRTFLIPVY